MSFALKKTKMPEQSPEVRNKNFCEVALGYSDDDAILEARRCLQCKTAPCRKGCPVEVDIPAFINQIKQGDIESSNLIIKSTNALPAVCGRVCPQEEQCEKYCVLAKKGEAVGIGRLERFVADYARVHGEVLNAVEFAANAQRVAVIGSGPASLTVAGELAKRSYKVTVFEALHLPGGVLMYGIPEFRLPKDIVQAEIANLGKLGVEMVVNSVIGQTFTVDELLDEEGFHAVFIGTGAGLPHFMGMEGENLNGVYSANEFLTRCNLMKAYQFPAYKTPIHVGKNVAVIGGGNVAMDAARTALRLGAQKVYIVYRRSEEEMPARREEVHHAKEEGVDFRLLTSPLSIASDTKGWVTGLKTLRMELGEQDSSGRRRPVEVVGSEAELAVDTVIIAIGQGPNPLVQATTTGLAVDKRGNIVADAETGETSRMGVFAGGDIVIGAATVILAMGAGKKAATAIDAYLQKLKTAQACSV
jgi:glutamate synthase (NADPH/NADH) small chain